jgi:hypothetical protein
MPRDPDKPQVGPKKYKGKDKRLRKGKRTVKNSTTAPRRLAITAAFRKKAAEAVEYRLMGYTFAQIGEAMGFDQSYAYRLVNWSLENTPIENAVELRAIQSKRLETMNSAILSDAFEGNSEAMDQARRNIDLFCRINGLFAPTKVEHSGEIEGGVQPIFIISEIDAKL